MSRRFSPRNGRQGGIKGGKGSGQRNAGFPTGQGANSPPGKPALTGRVSKPAIVVCVKTARFWKWRGDSRWEGDCAGFGQSQEQKAKGKPRKPSAQGIRWGQTGLLNLRLPSARFYAARSRGRLQKTSTGLPREPQVFTGRVQPRIGMTRRCAPVISILWRLAYQEAAVRSTSFYDSLKDIANEKRHWTCQADTKCYLARCEP